MTRFAVTVTVAMAALTVLAVVLISWSDDASEERLLTADDFRTVGLRPISFAQEELRMPGGEIRRVYTAGLGPQSDASVELRIGASRTAYADQLAHETRAASRPIENDSLNTIIEEQWGGTSAFVVRRVVAAGDDARLEVILWALEGSSIVVVKVRMRGIPPSDRTERLHTAELQARGLGTLAVDHLIEMKARRSERGSSQ